MATEAPATPAAPAAPTIVRPFVLPAYDRFWPIELQRQYLALMQRVSARAQGPEWIPPTEEDERALAELVRAIRTHRLSAPPRQITIEAPQLTDDQVLKAALTAGRSVPATDKPTAKAPTTVHPPQNTQRRTPPVSLAPQSTPTAASGAPAPPPALPTPAVGGPASLEDLLSQLVEAKNAERVKLVKRLDGLREQIAALDVEIDAIKAAGTTYQKKRSAPITRTRTMTALGREVSVQQTVPATEAAPGAARSTEAKWGPAALAWAEEHDGEIRVAELARANGVPPSRFYQPIARLVKDGSVEYVSPGFFRKVAR